MADGMLALSWNNHATTFCHMLSHIRQKDKYADATVACEGKFYPVHRIVLSTCSKYFEEMFELTSAGKHPIVLLQDVRKYELEAILSYMYAGVVSVAQKDLARLIKVAELLQIKGLAVPDELPSEKRSGSNQNNSNSSDRTSRGSHSVDYGDDRSSPYRKRRRRDERGMSPQASGSSVYNKDDDDIQEIKTSDFLSKEFRESNDEEQNRRLGVDHVENTSRNVHDPESRARDSELPHQQPSLDASGKSSKERDEMVFIKEEVIDDPVESDGASVKAELPYESIGNTGEDSVEMPLNDQDDYSQASHSQMSAEPAGEALAGPSGIHEWLSGGDLATIENYGGEGSPPTSDHPQTQQMGGLDRAKGQLGWRDAQGISSNQDRLEKASHCSSFKLPSPLHFSQNQNALSQSQLANLTCPYCPAKFTRRNHVIQHMRIHTGEKPFKCPYCPAAFAQKCNLIVHVRTHTGEKPYPCLYCDAKFPRKSTRDSHVASCHRQRKEANVGW